MTAHGKWSQPEVPHRGWSCIDVKDLGEPSAICEMCEYMEIRYVHHMAHPDYPTGLAVGCVCAENMEEDYVGPRLREKALRQLAKRRKNWSRQVWYRSSPFADDGCWYLNTDGYHLEVIRHADAFAVAVQRRDGIHRQEGRKRYDTEAEAKAAGLTALVWAKEHLV